MTLGEIFKLLSENPAIPTVYLMGVPFVALLALYFGKGEGNKSPWTELYSFLVYAICLPGIFAVTLNAYLFLFERQSVFDANIFTQVLPLLSMIVTLWLIRKNTCFEDIPGFNKLGGLVTLISVLFILMWILEKTHIFVISFMPFHYFLILLVVLLIAIRFGWRAIYN